MSSPLSDAPVSGEAVQLAVLHDLYRRSLFLDAFRQTASFWTLATNPRSLSADELLFATRLSVRLGGLRLSRWLFRIAHRSYPTHPWVRYLALFGFHSFHDVLRDRLAFEESPELGDGDLEVRAAWFATHATFLAQFRDFARAHECIERASALLPQDSWVLHCQSTVLAASDRWQEALNAAELCWQAGEGAPFAAHSLGAALLNLGRVEEAASRMTAAAQNTQSYELVLSAAWHQCLLAETLDSTERSRALDAASDLAARLPSLAPLADRESRAQFARMRFEIAKLRGDHQEMASCAEQARAPFYRQVLENLRKNPASPPIRLASRRPRQKHQACLPTSISTVLSVMDVPFDADAMAAEVTFGGTPYWVAAEWLQRHGFAVRFFPVTPEVAASLVKDGIAFVLGLESEDFAHAVAVIGLDEAAGTLLFHDPDAFRLGEYLSGFVGWKEAPIGPRGMAIVPQEKAALLDQLLPAHDSDAMTASLLHQKAVYEQGAVAAREVLSGLQQRLPEHPLTRLRTAVQAGEEGHSGVALALLQQLLAAYPDSSAVRSALLSVCTSIGNTALTLQVLSSIVERGSLPGTQSHQPWSYPPAAYIAGYSDLLLRSAGTRPKAQRLLRSALRRQSSNAQLWHCLGDLFWYERDDRARLLTLRFASCLALENDHYARSYCDALISAGREEQGFQWLESRVRSFAGSARAVGPWITWISALEDWGHPERALTAALEALREHRSSPVFLAFIVRFLARMGQREEAQACLKELLSAGKSAFACETATVFYRMSGDLEEALRHCADWVRESPRSIPARQALLDLTSRREGPRASLALASRWFAENPDHDAFETLYAEQMDSSAILRWRKDRLLYRRVKRNSEDGWTWRELTFRRIADYDRAGQRRQERLRPRIAALLAQCDRTAPTDTATLRAHALWQQAQGFWAEAVSGWRKSLEVEPDSYYSYRKLWDCCARLPEAEQLSLLRQLEPSLLRSPGHLSIARDLALLIAERFGATTAEGFAARWQAARPSDPEVIRAQADLLLEHGHGRSDAARALTMLQSAVLRFPYDVALHFSLVRACLEAGKFQDAEKNLRELVARHPDEIDAHIQLARALESQGNAEEARRLMESITSRSPLSTSLWEARVRILLKRNKFSEARVIIERGVQSLPDAVGWRARAISLLLECGDTDGAVEAAREGVRVFPHGAYLWFLLGSTLARAKRFDAPGEIEACFRRSLALNATLFEAADNLAILLADQRRYDEAAEIMTALLPRLADASPARGRLAWIHRAQGHKPEALDELASVLRDAPWYRWGWAVLVEWVGEDRAWQKARTLLASVPSALRSEPQFQRQRLAVLEQAGASATELDAEWNQLLRDFPEDVSLYLHRYDGLVERKLFAEAGGVLRAILPIDSNSPYVRARLVEVLVQEGKHKEAEDALLGLWFVEVERSTWPASYAWQSVQKPGRQKQVYARAKQSLKEGSCPTPQALALMADFAMLRESAGKKKLQPALQSLLPGPGAREVLSLLKLLGRCSRADVRRRLELLRRLLDFGYHRNVIRYWKKHRSILDADVDAWGCVGRSLVTLQHRREARRYLGDWRTRPGVRMWMVANYVLSHRFVGRGNFEEIRSACSDALAKLPHDHTARYLAHILADANIQLKDMDGLRAVLLKHRNLFTGALLKSEFFTKRQNYLLDRIPALVSLLDQPDQLRRACFKLRLRRLALFLPPLMPLQ